MRRLLYLLSFPLLLLVAAAVLLVWRSFSYEQHDNPEHLAGKRQYLEQIAARPPVSGAPNVVFILLDDLGYGDLGFTGSRAVRTPHLDQLAAQGVVFTRFYSPSPVCTPSRAGFLTGRLAPRAGLPDVVFPTGSTKSLITLLSGSNHRLPAEEITLTEVLQASGYRTAMVGKWHLGDRSPSLPNDFGFDQYFGALYSNDMEPFSLYQNDELAIQAPVDQRQLNKLYSEQAVSYIDQFAAGERPFFLYYAHNFPHRPLYSDPIYAGSSEAGLYGDVVEDIDRGIGAIVAALHRHGELDNTVILFSSDNGPWYQGSAGVARGRKGDTFEGGMHVPFLVHWPERLAGGREESALAMGTDLFPTLLDWLQLPLPDDRIIDGYSLAPLLRGDTESARDALFYVASSEVMAVRDDRFKYHDRRPVFYAPMPSPVGFSIEQGPWLFDMQLDPEEAYDVSGRYPQQAALLQQRLADKRHEWRDNLRGWRD